MTEERKRLLEEHLPEWFNKKSKSASSQKSSSSKSTSHSSSSSINSSPRITSPPKPRSYLQPLPNPKDEKSTQYNFNPPHLSELSTYHKKFKTLHSSTYFSRIQSNPEEFKHYHQLSKKAEEHDSQEDLPLHIIAGYLQQFPSNLQVADLGCGDATLDILCLLKPIQIGFNYWMFIIQFKYISFYENKFCSLDKDEFSLEKFK